jgi:hypothetical protein
MSYPGNGWGYPPPPPPPPPQTPQNSKTTTIIIIIIILAIVGGSLYWWFNSSSTKEPEPAPNLSPRVGLNPVTAVIEMGKKLAKLPGAIVGKIADSVTKSDKCPVGDPIEGMSCAGLGQGTACHYDQNGTRCFLHCEADGKWNKRGNNDIYPRNVCTNNCPNVGGGKIEGDATNEPEGTRCKYRGGSGKTLNCTCVSDGKKWTNCGSCKLSA